MSSNEQELSEGIRTNHELSDNKRRLKRPRDSRDSSQQTELDPLEGYMSSFSVLLSAIYAYEIIKFFKFSKLFRSGNYQDLS